MRKTVIFLGILVAGSAFAFNIDASVGMWKQSPGGYIQYPRDTGDKVYLKDTLGLGDEVRPFGRLKVEVPILPNLYLGYFPSKFSGTNYLPYTVVYGDFEFDTTVEVKSEITIDRMDGMLYYNIPFISSLTGGVLEGEIGLGVRYFRVDGKLTGRDVNTNQIVTEEAKEEFPLPVLYASAGINVPTPFIPLIKKVSLYGEGRGIAYSNSSYYQVGGELRVFPLKNIYLFGGMMVEKLKIDEQDVDVFADLQIKGFYAGAGFSF